MAVSDRPNGHLDSAAKRRAFNPDRPFPRMVIPYSDQLRIASAKRTREQGVAINRLGAGRVVGIGGWIFGFSVHRSGVYFHYFQSIKRYLL